MRSPFEQRAVRLRHHATLVAPSAHPQLVSVSVGPLGEATALWTDPDGLAAIGADGQTAKPQRTGAPGAPVSSTVTVQAPERHDAIEIALDTAFPMVQPLPDGQVLVVGARAEWRADGPENNATIYGPDGSPLLTACIGDGIEHVRTTPGGAVWIAYFDEGVYGNLGWGEPGGPEPMGWPGLVRTNRELEIEWRYPADELDPIDDCYALTVNGEDVWAWTYSSFAITRVQNSQVRSWPTRADGGDALIGDGERVALVGGRSVDHDRLVLGRLDQDFTELGRARLAMPDAAPLPVAATKVGRADELHVFVGPEWFRVSLEDLGR